jgi:hypothetical protein
MNRKTSISKQLFANISFLADGFHTHTNTAIPTIIEKCQDGLAFKASALKFTTGTPKCSNKIDFYNIFLVIPELCAYFFPWLTLQRSVFGLRHV